MDEVIEVDTQGRDDRNGLVRDKSRNTRNSRSRKNGEDIYAIPTLDEFDSVPLDVDHLPTPPLPVHPEYGEMQAFWASINMDNGARIDNLMRMGYSVVNPSVVPEGYRGLTRLWENRGECIMCNNEMILMQIPKSIFEKRRMQRRKESFKRMQNVFDTNNCTYRDTDLTFSNPIKVGVDMGGDEDEDYRSRRNYNVRKTHFGE